MSLESMMPAGAAELEAARLLLARLGIAPADLLPTTAARLLPTTAARPPAPPPASTFAAYIPVVSAAVGTGTRRVYGSYWNRIADYWGHRRLDEPTPSDIHLLVERVKAQRVVRRNGRSGRSSAEHLIAALRCLYAPMPWPTATSARPTTRPARWPSRGGCPAPAARSPTPGWRRSTRCDLTEAWTCSRRVRSHG
jgi:hypothetical protein